MLAGVSVLSTSLSFSSTSPVTTAMSSVPLASGTEDMAVVTGDVLENDSDVDNTLTPASITGYSQGGNGSVVYNNDGTFTYTPNLDFNGSDSFTYTLSDGLASATATVHGTVDAVNDAPVINAPGSSVSFAINEDTPLTFNSISVSDVDAHSNPIQLLLSVAHGALTLASTSGLAGDLDGSDG